MTANSATTLTSQSDQENQAKSVVIAQISDCHLFAEPDGLHHGYNVLDNLNAVLTNIRQNEAIKYLIFTGDLTQDHSEQSYKNFVDAVQKSQLTIPIYYVPGNHDEPELLNRFLSPAPFNISKTIDLPTWQVQLISSKSETPAGRVSTDTIQSLSQAIDKTKHQLVFMHHHPIDVGFFIDKHGLKNQTEFWSFVEENPNVKAIACGHVHAGLTKTKKLAASEVVLYTCPATSIQFDQQAETVAALKADPAYRLFTLQESGDIESQVIEVK